MSTSVWGQTTPSITISGDAYVGGTITLKITKLPNNLIGADVRRYDIQWCESITESCIDATQEPSGYDVSIQSGSKTMTMSYTIPSKTDTTKNYLKTLMSFQNVDGVNLVEIGSLSETWSEIIQPTQACANDPQSSTNCVGYVAPPPMPTPCPAGQTRNADGDCETPNTMTEMPGGEMPSETPSDTNQQNPPSQNMANTGETTPPPAASSSSSGGIALLAIAGAGGYYWWKKRQIQNGNAAKVALLPDVSFDLDRSDRRAFYTKFNWQNPGDSNWQIRSNLALHTKYSGKLLDWHANSHIGYRLNGKFGDFNPYLRGKFVQNAPENAEMQKTYSLGLNYAIPNRFSVQIAQPDSEIRRFSLNTQWHLPKNISLQLNQPNSDLANYAFGVSWRKSKIRYGISGETGSNSYRLSGEFWF